MDLARIIVAASLVLMGCSDKERSDAADKGSGAPPSAPVAPVAKPALPPPTVTLPTVTAARTRPLGAPTAFVSVAADGTVRAGTPPKPGDAAWTGDPWEPGPAPAPAAEQPAEPPAS